MTNKNHFITMILIFLVGITLSGCGGGGGSTPTATTLATTTDALTLTGTIQIPGATDHSGVVVQLMAQKDGITTAISRMINGDITPNSAILRAADADLGIYMGVTDSNGHYFINNIPRGQYLLSASKGDFFAAQQQVNLQITDTTTEPVVEVNVQLTPTGAFAGTVATNPATTDRSGFLCYIAGTSYLSITDNTGNFKISGVPATEPYYITISKPGFVTVKAGPFTITAAGVVTAIGTQTLSIDTGNTTSAVVMNANSYYPTGNLGLSFVTTTTPVLMSFKYEKVDGGVSTTNPVAYQNTYGFSMGNEGKYLFTGYFYYADGSRHESHLAQPVYFDSTIPTIKKVNIDITTQPQVFNSAPNSIHARDLYFSVEASDALSGISDMRYTINGTVGAWESWNPEKYMMTPLNLPAGSATNTIVLEVRDNSQNVASITKTIDYYQLKTIRFDDDKAEIPRTNLNLFTDPHNGSLFAIFDDGAQMPGLRPDSILATNGSIDANFNYIPPVSGDDMFTASYTLDGITAIATIEVMFSELRGIQAETRDLQLKQERGTTFDLKNIPVFADFPNNQRVAVDATTLVYLDGGSTVISGGNHAFLSPGTEIITIEYTVAGVTQSTTVEFNIYELTAITPLQQPFQLGEFLTQPLVLDGRLHYSDAAFDRIATLTPSVTLGSISGANYNADGGAGSSDITWSVTTPSSTGITATTAFSVVANPIPLITNYPAGGLTQGYLFVEVTTTQLTKAELRISTISHDTGNVIADFNSYAKAIKLDNMDTTHYFELLQLNDGTTYYYRVMVMNENGQFSISAENMFDNLYADVEGIIDVNFKDETQWLGADLPSGTTLTLAANNAVLTGGVPTAFYAFTMFNPSNAELATFKGAEFQIHDDSLNTLNGSDLFNLRLFRDDGGILTPIQTTFYYTGNGTLPSNRRYVFEITDEDVNYLFPDSESPVYVLVAEAQNNMGALQFSLNDLKLIGTKSGATKVTNPVIPINMFGNLYDIQ